MNWNLRHITNLWNIDNCIRFIFYFNEPEIILGINFVSPSSQFHWWWRYRLHRQLDCWREWLRRYWWSPPRSTSVTNLILAQSVYPHDWYFLTQAFYDDKVTSYLLNICVSSWLSLTLLKIIRIFVKVLQNIAMQIMHTCTLNVYIYFCNKII